MIVFIFYGLGYVLLKNVAYIYLTQFRYNWFPTLQTLALIRNINSLPVRHK